MPMTVREVVRAALGACLLSSAAVPAAGGGFTGPDGSYRLDCPDGWTVRETGAPAVEAAFFCDADQGVNFTVTRVPAPGEAELSEEAVREMQETFRSSYPGYRITADEWREVAGARAFCLSARYAQAGLELQNRQVMFIRDGIFYTLTYTATPASFMRHLGDFERAVESFRIGAAGSGGSPGTP
ncbi:MAG: DcrB-related protein [bacterium]|nr:DcrB-related protein [bacterium]